MTNIQLRTLDMNSKDIKNVKRIYREAFPLNERIPFCMLMRKANTGMVDFSGIYNSNKLLGFSYVLHEGDIAYLGFYALAKAEQGKGYGTTALKLLIRRYKGCRFFLALEQLDKSASNYEQRLSRHRFYQRCGLKDMPYVLKDISGIYMVMGTGGSAVSEKHQMDREDFSEEHQIESEKRRMISEEHQIDPEEHQMNPKEYQTAPEEHQINPKEYQTAPKAHQAAPKAHQIDPEEYRKLMKACFGSFTARFFCGKIIPL